MYRIESKVVLVSSSAKISQITHESIALRAYDKWLGRGCRVADGESQDWFAALAELQRERLESSGAREPPRQKELPSTSQQIGNHP